jgi:HEPN domain-containing protein
MSSPHNPPPGSPEDWLVHARSDLAYARTGEHDPDILPNQVAFHAQQAAEKAIKAVLVHRAIAFPKTHDLKDLIKRWTSIGEVWPPELADTKSLNPYAFETRYPGYIHQISTTEVRKAIEAAEQVLNWAENVVKSPPSSEGEDSK